MNNVRQIAIIGTGLLGGSLGLALRRDRQGKSPHVVGVGRRRQTVDRALELGCLDQGTTDIEEAVSGSQLVVLATPLSAIQKSLEQLAEHDHPDLVLTDVGSIKASVCAWARQRLGAGALARFVGSHPMAGSEMTGPDAARADLFRNKPCILTPEDETDPAALRTVRALWERLEMRLFQMTPDEHDRHVGCISHVPHAVASMLVHLAARRGRLEIASTGLRDTSRIASADPALWRDIFTGNREGVMENLTALEVELTRFKQFLASEDGPGLLEWLKSAKEARDRWTGQFWNDSES